MSVYYRSKKHHWKPLGFLQRMSGNAMPKFGTIPIRKNPKDSWTSRINVHDPDMVGITMEATHYLNIQRETLIFAADRPWMRIEQQACSTSHSAGLQILYIPCL